MKQKSSRKHSTAKACSSKVENAYRINTTAFAAVFQSIQYVGICALYDEFEFSQNDQKIFSDAFKERFRALDGSSDSMALIQKCREEYGIRCEEYAASIPSRVFMKAAGLKGFKEPYEMNQLIYGAREASSMYFSLAVECLITNFSFSTEKAGLFCRQVVSILDNFRNGMTTEFVRDYIIDYVDLDLKN